jgi:hypothetical protein
MVSYVKYLSHCYSYSSAPSAVVDYTNVLLRQPDGRCTGKTPNLDKLRFFFNVDKRVPQLKHLSSDPTYIAEHHVKTCWVVR